MRTNGDIDSVGDSDGVRSSPVPILTLYPQGRIHPLFRGITISTVDVLRAQDHLHHAQTGFISAAIPSQEQPRRA